MDPHTGGRNPLGEVEWECGHRRSAAGDPPLAFPSGVDWSTRGASPEALRGGREQTGHCRFNRPKKTTAGRKEAEEGGADVRRRWPALVRPALELEVVEEPEALQEHHGAGEIPHDGGHIGEASRLESPNPF